MEIKILYAGALFLVGWMWFFIFVRQFLFNIITAYPLIKKMRSLQDELIAIGASRYTTISLILCFVVAGIILTIVILLCPVHMLIGFAAGALVAFVMYINKLGPKTKATFETFCNGYYRFVPDDELRTAMYNKKFGQMKSRLKAMGLADSFIPEFKN